MKSITTTLKMIKKFLLKNFIDVVFLSLATYVLVSSPPSHRGIPEIVFFDVGQGDAILIQQDNFQVLIDGGPDDAIIYDLAKKMPRYDKNIEIVVLTHPHDDHIRGLMNVLDEFSVGRILINKIEYENESYNYLLDNYPHLLSNLVQGDAFQYRDIYATVIYPPKDKVGQDENINNESVVILLEIKGKRILLMGDAEWEIESKLIASYDLENIYILKAGHHCSRTASSDMFLKATKPDIAVCSCSKDNKFGHPHYETIEKFQKLSVQHLVTYKEGDVVIKFGDL